MNETSLVTDENSLLTKRELAARLRISPRSIDNLLQRGLPYLRLGSRTIRFDASDTMKWLTEHYRTQRGAK